MPVFFHRVKYCRHVFQRDIVVKLHVEAEAAFGQVQAFHTLTHVIKQPGSCGEGKELAVKVEIPPRS